MAGFNYAKSVITADRLIQKFGASAAIRRLTPGAGPDHNPGPSTPVDHPCKAVRLQFSKSEIDGTQVLAGDVRLYVSARNFALDLNPTTDRLVFNGVAYTIVPPVNQLNPAGTNVYWSLQGRV
jgi:hypothetical protein